MRRLALAAASIDRPPGRVDGPARLQHRPLGQRAGLLGLAFQLGEALGEVGGPVGFHRLAERAGHRQPVGGASAAGSGSPPAWRRRDRPPGCYDPVRPAPRPARARRARRPRHRSRRRRGGGSTRSRWRRGRRRGRCARRGSRRPRPRSPPLRPARRGARACGNIRAGGDSRARVQRRRRARCATTRSWPSWLGPHRRSTLGTDYRRVASTQ